MVFLQACLCIMCMLGICRGQKRWLNPLNLELDVVVSYHVGTGNQTWSPGRAKSASNH